MDIPNQTSDRMSDFYLALAIALVAVIITFLLSRRLKKPVNVILLTGIPDSGKTTLFTKIIFNESKKSVTSLKENEAVIEEMNIKLIDLPGADRLRGRFWEQFRSRARHIIFVVDSTTLETKMRDVSEHLYLVLSDASVHNNKVRVTIACNKQDVEEALKSEKIGPMLEKELVAIRNTKSGQLAKTSNEEREDYLSRMKTRDITFENLGVNLIETSAYEVEQLIKTIF